MNFSLILLNPCIQMDVNADYMHEECYLGIVSYSHVLQMIVIENTVIDSFCAGTVLIDVLEFLTFSRNRPKVSWVILHAGVDNASK